MVQETKDHMDELCNQLDELSQQKAHIQEQLELSEAKAREFEYVIGELESQVSTAKHSNVEELLKEENSLLKEEVNRLSSKEDSLKNETSDMSNELYRLKMNCNEAESKIKKLEALQLTFEEDRSKSLSKSRDLEKDIRDLRESVSTKEKKVAELQFKLGEELIAKQELKNKLDALTSENANTINKLQEDNLLLQNMVKSFKEEQESNPKPQHQPPAPNNTLTFKLPVVRAESNISSSQEPDAVEQPAVNLETDVQPAEEEAEQSEDVFAELAIDAAPKTNSGFQNSSMFIRRDTMEGRLPGLSNQQSRRNSNLSNRFHLRGFGSHKNADEKLVAELNELKVKSKQAQEDHAKRFDELMVAWADRGDPRREEHRSRRAAGEASRSKKV